MTTASWKDYVDYIKNRGNIEEILIIAIDDGSILASSSPDTFFLRKYNTPIMQEDGTEKEELVNEAENILKLMKGQSCGQGLRLNGQKKQQITRTFTDDKTGLPALFSKIPNGGSCIANAGKCILIGTFNELKEHQSPACNETILMMAMYLCKSNWPDEFEGSDNNNTANAGTGGGGGEEGDWQAHVDKALVAKGNIAEAMIVDASTGEILASTPNFTLQTYQADIAQEDGTDKNETIDEAKNLRQLLTQKLKTSQGLRINQIKYQIVRSLDDENSLCYTVYGKKAMGGITISYTGKVLIVGTFDEKKNHTNPACNNVISDLAKYLKQTL